MPHILIGTPGRIHDLIRRKKLNSKTIKMLVLDEADDMLSTGFKDQIYSIFQHLSNDIQIVLFSATLPTDILQLTSKFMRDPINILVKKDSVTLEGIKQYYVAIDDDHQKYETLKDLYEALIKDSFPVCQIHSEMDKSQRESSYQEFVNGGSRVLISTNLTARGIDVQQVSTVINFDLPKDIHTYIHRIGRSGRWGRKGLGINLVTRRDIRNMKEIESYYETQIDELPSSFGK